MFGISVRRGGIPRRIPDNVESLSHSEVESFLKEWEGKVRNENEQSEKQKLTNIKPLPNVSMEVPKWLMDRTKEAAALYVNGYWLASIAQCGSIGEYVTRRTLQDAIREKRISILVEFRRSLQWQSNRIKLLRKTSYCLVAFCIRVIHLQFIDACVDILGDFMRG
jgi:hypothetical protein